MKPLTTTALQPLNRGLRRDREISGRYPPIVSVQPIQPEPWEGFLSRIPFAQNRPVRLSWIAIRRDNVWLPYAITVRVLEIAAPSSSFQGEATWIESVSLRADEVIDRLRNRRIADELQAFETQDSYAGYWLTPGTTYGIGRSSGWPEYYTDWPLNLRQDLQYSVQWHAPFRAGRHQYKTLIDIAMPVLFGNRFSGGPANDIRPTITARIPYPYRLAEVQWTNGQLLADVDWSGSESRHRLSIHANWRVSQEQLEPDSAEEPAGETGGTVAFVIGTQPSEAELFLNDPEIPVPCQEWHWPEQAAAPVTITLTTEEESVVAATPTNRYSNPPIDFSRLTSDESMRQVLTTRWDEAWRCLDAGALTATMVMAGSVLEGALLSVARERPDVANASSAPKTKDGGVLPVEKWRFDVLIRVAMELEWLPITISGFANAVRALRNFVHPWEERTAGDTPSPGLAQLCLLSVDEILRRLATADKEPGP